MSNPELKSQARLYGILARNAKRAVVFRRGPNKQVLLVLWNTETDEFAEGQWLKGRIYERHPIEYMRLTRDGWRFVQDGRAVQHGAKQSVWIRFEPPMIYAKPNLAQRSRYELQRQTHGLNERQGAWYITEHVVRDQKSGETVSLGRTDWADWCHSGDLLFGKDGQLYRLGFGRDGSLKRSSEAKLLIDLTDRTFRELPPTTEAAQWTTRSVD